MAKKTMKTSAVKGMKKEMNYGAGKNCLPYDKNPAIGGTDEAKKPNKGLQTSMFGPDALESGIATTPSYAAKSKAGYFNPKVVDYIEENTISPTAKY